MALHSAPDWRSWITNLGHDTYAYPAWINAQISGCSCRRAGCFDERGAAVQWRSAANLTFCTAKAWMLEHMPEFDKHYLPPSVTVNGTSMLDDHIAFALMADKAAPWSDSVPIAAKLAYVLPYAAYHEARQNWRPLLFAKFFAAAASAPTVAAAVQELISPNVFLNWTGNSWPSSPAPPAGVSYQLHWESSTNPPVIAPLEFVAYGYGSCTAWATLLAYTLRALGVPARQAGTPCWNSQLGGVDFRGLAATNKNVSLCWHGGSATRGHGGNFLNNHNWVEFYDPDTKAWRFVNVPPGTKTPDAGLCGDSFDGTKGCGFNVSAPAGRECDGVSGGPGAAMRDHEILAATWSKGDEPGAAALEGGAVVDAAQYRLSSGELVSPLVWAPGLTDAFGEPLRNTGLRFVNRTSWYRCKPTAEPTTVEAGAARGAN
jgi:hypothetical protein